jgi:hypothetical protein
MSRERVEVRIMRSVHTIYRTTKSGDVGDVVRFSSQAAQKEQKLSIHAFVAMRT